MAATNRTAIILAFAAVYLIWGSTYLGILFAIQSIPPFLMAGVRYSTAGLIMYGLTRAQGAARPGRAGCGGSPSAGSAGRARPRAARTGG